MTVRIFGIVAVIILSGLGLYFAVFVPLVAGHFVSVPYGALLLVAAIVVLILLIRQQRRGTAHFHDAPENN